MRYPVQKIARVVEGRFLFSPPHEGVIEHILLDSRQVIFPATSLFIALQGRRHDGHDFIGDLCQSGVRNFIISAPSAVLTADHQNNYPGCNFVLVENTQEAFHQLAAWHRQQFSLPVIGITGSNGKTIIKEWLFQLLHKDYHIVRSPKSFNSQTGVPLSVLQISSEHQLALIEAGISQMGEMEKLARIIAPDIGIFTKIGEAHSEGFPSIEIKLRQKLKLFKRAKTVIFCTDDERVVQAMEELIQDNPGVRFFTWSAMGKPADIHFNNICSGGDFTEITAEYALSEADPEPTEPLSQPKAGNAKLLKIPFTDAASIENALHCWAFLLYLGIPHKDIACRMARLEPVAMRLDLKEGINGCTVINDSYNSDLTSLNIALNFLEQQSKAVKRTVILSDILQSGQAPEQLYQTVADLLLEKRIDRLIGIGTEVTILEQVLPQDFDRLFFENTPSFLEAFHRLVFRDETILLKGARRFEFERIAGRLTLKFHKTVLEINLSALLHNLRMYQMHLQPGTRLMAMVKAGAYGSGSIEVAKLLEFQHVDYLGVAYADEGVELRKAGIQLPIMVMNPEEATFEVLVRHRLEPEIYSLKLLVDFMDSLRRQFYESSLPAEWPYQQAFPVHLKIETGMHRLGFENGDLEEVVRLINRATPPLVSVKSIFSHLAASESPQYDEFTRGQAGRFHVMSEKLISGLGYRPMRHLLNSGGIIRFPEYQMEMVRLGIGLYGIDSSRMIQEQLQTVNTLKASISQIKHLKPGETVGYGRIGRADRPMRIATLSLGYADGLLRKAGNGGYHVLVRNKKAPTIGNVCMDMTMVDVTDIPEAQEGDPVIIFGKDLLVQELAASLGTIPYEIFTTISDRVKRVYVQE